MADKVSSLLGFKTPEGVSAAEKAIQRAQSASVEREAIRAAQKSAASIAARGISGQLRFTDDRKKSTIGG